MTISRTDYLKSVSALDPLTQADQLIELRQKMLMSLLSESRIDAQSPSPIITDHQAIWQGTIDLQARQQQFQQRQSELDQLDQLRQDLVSSPDFQTLKQQLISMTNSSFPANAQAAEELIKLFPLREELRRLNEHKELNSGFTKWFCWNAVQGCPERRNRFDMTTWGNDDKKSWLLAIKYVNQHCPRLSSQHEKLLNDMREDLMSSTGQKQNLVGRSIGIWQLITIIFIFIVTLIRASNN